MVHCPEMVGDQSDISKYFAKWGKPWRHMGDRVKPLKGKTPSRSPSFHNWESAELSHVPNVQQHRIVWNWLFRTEIRSWKNDRIYHKFLHCSFCILVKRVSSSGSNWAHIAEHIAAQFGGLSSNSRAAAAVDFVFTVSAFGKFSARKSRHWPNA